MTVQPRCTQRQSAYDVLLLHARTIIDNQSQRDKYKSCFESCGSSAAPDLEFRVPLVSDFIFHASEICNL